MSRDVISDTRTALLGAGRALLLSEAGFSMGKVARRAGVSRQAVYLHFDDRYALLDAIVKHALSTSGRAPSLDVVTEACDAEDALRAMVEMLVAITADHGALDRAVRAVLAADPELATRWASRPGRRAAVQRVAERLELERALRPELDRPSAEAILGSLTTTDVLLQLLDTLPEPDVVDVVERSLRGALLRD